MNGERCGKVMSKLESAELVALMDERARQIVEREGVEAEERARLDALRCSVATAREGLDRFWLRPLKVGKQEVGIPSVVAVRVLAALLSFIFFNGFIWLSPYLPWAPAAVACPLVCEGCALSARSMYRGVPHDASGSHMPDTTTVCRNSKIDIDQLDDVQLMTDARLDPYRINIALRLLIDFILFIVTAAPLVWYPLARLGWVNRHARAAELRRLEEELTAALGNPPSSATDTPYR